MKTALKINKNSPISAEELFKYFINKDIVRQWASTNGRSPELPIWDVRDVDRYRYEHSSKWEFLNVAVTLRKLYPNCNYSGASNSWVNA